MQIYALSITYIHKRSNMYLLNEYFQLNKKQKQNKTGSRESIFNGLCELKT